MSSYGTADSIDWQGAGVIMGLDIPINYLMKMTSPETLWLGSGLGFLQYFYFGTLVRQRGLVLQSNTWDGMSALFTTLMGVFWFGEKLDQIEWISTLMIVGGLLLLGFHDYLK